MICSVTIRDVIRTRKEINKPNLYDRLEVLIPSKRPIRPMNDMSLSEILLLHYGIGASCAHLLSINSGYHPFIKYSMVSATVPMQKVEHFFTRNRSFLDYDLQKLRNAHIKELIHKLTYLLETTPTVATTSIGNNCNLPKRKRIKTLFE